MKQNNSEFSNIDLIVVKNCLIVPIQLDLYDEFISQLKKQILAKINQSSIIGIIIDISAIKIIDSINLENILKLCKMTRLMGKETVITGFQPSVASVLTEFPELELNQLVTFINLESSIKYLTNKYKNKSTVGQRTREDKPIS